MTKEFQINISDFVWTSMVFWRTTWNTIKKKFDNHYAMWFKIIFNFKNIDSVTHSFIDELIWAYIFYDSEKALERIKFINCNNDIKWMIKFVVNDRLSNSAELQK